MFYRPENGHGLPHNPLNALVAPRPIGWISTRGRLGDNLAPYSFFNLTAYVPPQVMFASTSAKPDRPGTKDSVAQIVESRVFCVNIADGALREQVNASSAMLPAGTSEFAAVGIEAAECETIDCPRVAGAAASLECRMTRVLRLAGEANVMVLGVVTGIHLRPDCLQQGRFRPPSGWLARLGYMDYCITTETFEMERP
ncbi:MULTISPECIES: flavin reductase family protein [unclassified Paracoccus (in: a-proteobacteria)]|uniref:flavin reductase family protein n=1 Tax=unclassified Paracoccus (in: a-proteobacteria) TaxID=2688777 RepID=UPI0012B40827|nr:MULTISPECIES: flavin reductase family protein [unclassified Paracoccus (in: a-proteobacteria)]UXU74747.1 flavin reductase family protein [Paracoccus sp. SMMA_5]UXU80644.1 flavin reductase family protein [Paracoccus sp. SMMA_5_TC]